MLDPLLPPPDLAPSATPAQCIQAWVEWMDLCEQFLPAGLRREIGPEGDLRGAYRRWYAEQMEEHDRTMVHLASELQRRDTLDRDYLADGAGRLGMVPDLEEIRREAFPGSDSKRARGHDDG